jgi:hypothetical protein
MKFSLFINLAILLQSVTAYSVKEDASIGGVVTVKYFENRSFSGDNTRGFADNIGPYICSGFIGLELDYTAGIFSSYDNTEEFEWVPVISREPLLSFPDSLLLNLCHPISLSPVSIRDDQTNTGKTSGPIFKSKSGLRSLGGRIRLFEQGEVPKDQDINVEINYSTKALALKESGLHVISNDSIYRVSVICNASPFSEKDPYQYIFSQSSHIAIPPGPVGSKITAMNELGIWKSRNITFKLPKENLYDCNKLDLVFKLGAHSEAEIQFNNLIYRIYEQ